LKIGKFTHADAGQMNLYLNYAREHWALPGENPPLGLILCSEKNEAVAHYALGNLHNKVLASQYKLALPDEKELAQEIARTRQTLLQQTQPARNKYLSSTSSSPIPVRTRSCMPFLATSARSKVKRAVAHRPS
jgi:YhcG PDDEXK nuclease domain